MKRFFNSFVYAINGIFNTIKNEKNIKIQILIMILVIILGIILRISLLEWIICIVLFGMVFSMEVMNTAIEDAVDLVSKEKTELARLAKDAAAGAVLINSIVAAIVGVMIFLPKIMK